MIKIYSNKSIHNKGVLCVYIHECVYNENKQEMKKIAYKRWSKKGDMMNSNGW